ncbi:MAG: hypothetical protein L6R37_001617 [Teloschistes peruensis]|nr:MAG: hypothetical protein L6R37_001617 [Teloschistes peruensis]
MQIHSLFVSLTAVLSLVSTSTVAHLHRAHGSLSQRSNGVNHLVNRDDPVSKNGKLTFTLTPNVTRVTINNPPINLLTTELLSDLYDFMLSTRPSPDGKTPTPKVVIFSSALPDFFISHFDLKNLQQPPSTPSTSNNSHTLPLTHLIAIGRLLQNTTSTTFIAEINGRTFGGGQELAAQMDMRFAGPSALISQYENSCGFVAQAGGQLSLGPIIGKARALEHLLAAKQIDARTGTQLGLFNADYATPAILRAKVTNLAKRIALFPQKALNDTKFSLSFLSPTKEQLDEQMERFAAIAGGVEARETVREILRESEEEGGAGGAGGVEYEVGVPNSVVEGLYGEVLRGMGDAGVGVLDAVGTERVN